MHTPAISFPDVEDLLVVYLSAEFLTRGETASVHTKVPEQRPSKFVLVPRGGGVRRNLVVDSPTINFECWAATDVEACNLCILTRALVNALPGRKISGSTFYRVDEFGGPINLPDDLSHQSRYTFTSSISCRGTQI